MAFKLSNDVPTMPNTFLEHILSIFKVWSISAKNLISSIRDLKQPNLISEFRRELLPNQARRTKVPAVSFCFPILRGGLNSSIGNLIL